MTLLFFQSKNHDVSDKIDLKKVLSDYYDEAGVKDMFAIGVGGMKLPVNKLKFYRGDPIDVAVNGHYV